MNQQSFIAPLKHYQGHLGLAAWSLVTLFLLRHDLYALNEGAANALLLSWSIADQVASSAVLSQLPDFRAIFFLPTGFLWTGNIVATKILTIILAAIAAAMLYSWKKQTADSESALLATGLLLISPLLISQIDTLSLGVYLLTVFVFGAWTDKAYRASPRSFGGWYFAQLVISAFCISLHPAGLAYPLTLLWSWHSEPQGTGQQKYFLVGISFTVLLMLIISTGWGWADISWLQNPLTGLGTILIPDSPLLGNSSTPRMFCGILVLALLIATLAKQFQVIRTQFIGRTLLIALTLSAFTGDQTWALLAMTAILYFGLPLMLRRTHPPTSASFLRQRGIALFLVFILSTIFMQADRVHYEANHAHALSAQDQLIQTMANEAERIRKANEQAEEQGKSTEPLRVASQWPSRTMIACKCDTFPLPPAAPDAAAQLNMLHSITHLLLDPKQTRNLALTKNLSLLGTEIETSSLQSGGVLLHVKGQGAATPNDGHPSGK